MNIHEFQAKALLRKLGILVPKAILVINIEDDIEERLHGVPEGIYVVKAQIHAGGRGKAGGVKVAKNKVELLKYSQEILGKCLVTPQTGPDGKIVNKIYIEEASIIKKELYLSFVLDRDNACISLIASSEGGTEIEELAHSRPDAIFKMAINNISGLSGYHVRAVAGFLNLTGDLFKDLNDLLFKLYEIFIKLDIDQLEINPLIINQDNKLMVLDAKINIDDNALFRQKEILEMYDPTEEDPLEVRAAKSHLSYVKMDGEIGCMVNGAGLAMATMDIIQLYGKKPANFLDVGGGADKEKVCEAFKIILADPKVKAILINIFGGIMQCDIIAKGVIEAVKEVSVQVPIVVRLAGTNFELGKKILDESGLKIISANDLDDAAQKIVSQI